MLNGIAALFRAEGCTGRVRRSAVGSKHLLPLGSVLLLIVGAGCERSALEPSAFDVWPSDARLLLNSGELALAAGDTFRLVSTVTNGTGTVLGRSAGGDGGGARGMPRLVWRSSNPAIARVDPNGLVEALGEGDAVISVSSGSLISFSKATISGKGNGKGGKTGSDPAPPAPEPVPVAVSVSPKSVTIGALGGSTQLSAVVYDGNLSPISTATVTWASANPEIASVDGSGKVTARAVGLALVIATSGSVADTATVEVRQIVASVAVSPTSRTIAIDDTVHLIAVARDANGNIIPDASFSWSSSNAGIASVTSAGVARGVAAGTATISATASGGQVSASSSISVVTSTSASVGSTTIINPGDDIQAKVNASPTGTIFTLRSGVHRMQRVVPKDGQQFIGEPGAVMVGAALLTQFVREGNYWVASNQKAVAAAHGSCIAERPRCGNPEDLFLDNEPLIHVGSLSQVTSGRWFFDYGAGKVYMADDPRGRKVELGATAAAFTGSASNVVIRGLTIEKYANRAQAGAVHAENGRGWIVENNLIQQNHGYAVRIGHGTRARNNRFLRNGQLGIGGIGDNVLVEGNEIAYNNVAGFNWGWEAGGSKFVLTVDLVVRGNHAHHNYGPGLWTDIENIYTLYEDNLVEDNDGPGIFHEISYDAIIRNNRVYRNAKTVQPKIPYSGAAGIFISSSGCPANPPANYRRRTADDGRRVCVEVYGNEVLDNDGAIGAVPGFGDRGNGMFGQYQTTGLYVHRNLVGGFAVSHHGLMGEAGAVYFQPVSDNRFDRNVYERVTAPWPFAWNGGGRPWTEWRTLGQDPNGSLR